MAFSILVMVLFMTATVASASAGPGKPKPGTPKLAYSPTLLDFGIVPPGYAGSMTFEIWNSGPGTLSYSLSENSAWVVSVIPSSGTSTGEHDTIAVSINTAGLSDGSYSALVRISSNGGSGTVTVRVTVKTLPNPVLAYNPTSLDFGTVAPGYAGSKTVEIWNSGTGTLTYSLSESTPWITGVNPSSGSSIGEHDIITVSIDMTGTPDGTYSGPVTIGSNGGSGTVTVHVKVQAPPNPILSYSPTSLDFGTVPPGYIGSKTFEIWNSGTGTLFYNLTEVSSWIASVVPSSGSSTGERDTITVTISTVGMSDGSYSAPVSISSNGGSGTVTVNVKVQTPPNPILAYEPSSLEFGTVPPGYSGNKTFEIWNSGTGTLYYNITENSSWVVNVVPSSGMSNGEHDEIVVTISTSGLLDGFYNAPLAVGSNGGSGTVTIYVTVQTPPVPYLSYDPSWLDFGTVPPGYSGNKTFEVWNSGTGTLTYSLVENSSWISSVLPSNGTSDGEHDTICVTISTGALPDGSYSAPVSIDSNGGSGTVMILVVVQTPPNPVLSYDPAWLYFGRVPPGYSGNRTFEIWNSGTGTLSYTLNESSPWIVSVVPSTGTSTGEHDTITVSIDTTGLSDGLFNSEVAISSNGGGGNVTVSVRVETPPKTDFTFAIGGDMGWNESWRHGRDTLSKLASDTSDEFFLHVGDLSLSTQPGTETAWCDWVKSYIGPSYPYQLISGNHEDSDPVLIDNFTKCLPDWYGSTGIYGKEYYFDYPSQSPLARFIFVSPGLNFSNGGIYSYEPGSPHLQWTVNAIDDARTMGIKWIIVGVHMTCLTMNNKTWAKCYLGQNLFNTLLEKKVDLIVTGHSHAYERAKQLKCATPDIYRPECVVDSDDNYTKGEGTAYVVSGTTGDVIDKFNSSDPEVPYFVKGMDANTPDYGWGYVRVVVTATSMSLYTVFVRPSGGTAWYDHFMISS